jgi:group II intron reverse transcriptase/maturase
MPVKTKPFVIPKQQVMQAYRLVKANAGAAGVDRQSLGDFEEDLKNNLYRIWNRMSSGSYFPPAVKAVAIPKKAGGERILGVPTVADRVAQMVVKLQIEPDIEPHFLEDSYGYRPGKSALDAVGVTRRRCWRYDWVVEFDIKRLFDNIPHDLLLKALRKHVSCKWALLYVERWLVAPFQQPDGCLVPRTQGTPQGGVVSPLLSNLFLHYVFDAWVRKHYPNIPWCRYADDGLLHCHSLNQAHELRDALAQRFRECGLELHPEKTKIVYCKDGKRVGHYPVKSFDFLGFTFRGRTSRNAQGGLFFNFSPAVSKESLNAMRRFIKRSNLRNRVDRSIEDIAKGFNPVLQGWINYYGRFHRSALYPFLRYFNHVLKAWVMCKFKRFRGKKTRAGQYLERMAKYRPGLFAHWRIGMTGVFA